MWQAKELGECDFGSVANKGVAGEILEVWQGKELATTDSLQPTGEEFGWG